MNWDLDVDVIVVGAGACGLVAASRLAESNLDIVMIEKMDEIRGNTALSQGMIPAAGTRFQNEAGIADSPEFLYEDIMRKNGRTSHPEVTRAVSEYARVVVEWLVDVCHVELSLCTDFNYPGFSQVRMHAPPSRSGKDLLRSLTSHIKKQANVSVALRAPLVSIILAELHSATKVAGVEMTQNGERVRIKAKAVILACNGFGANKKLIKKFIPAMADALYFGHEGNTGDGILVAREIGAEWASMSGFQGHASVAVPHGILITWGTMMTGGILLNAMGQRFTNELQGYSELSLEVMSQPDGIAFELFDQMSYDAASSISDFRVAVEAGAVRKFDSIADYEMAFGLPIGSGMKTLHDYNASAVPLKSFGRTEAQNASDLILHSEWNTSQADPFGRLERRLLHPPFYGIRIGPALFHTQGGLRINQHAQVLRKDGVPFSNLYAGGGAAEGLSGPHPKGYLSGNGLLAAVTLGYIAGSHVREMLNL